MDDAVGMAILYRVGNLEQNRTRLFFFQFAFFLHVLHQLAASRQLHDHDELVALDEGVIELDNVLMAQFLDAICLFVDRVHLVRTRHCAQITTLFHNI